MWVHFVSGSSDKHFLDIQRWFFTNVFWKNKDYLNDIKILYWPADEGLHFLFLVDFGAEKEVLCPWVCQWQINDQQSWVHHPDQMGFSRKEMKLIRSHEEFVDILSRLDLLEWFFPLIIIREEDVFYLSFSSRLAIWKHTSLFLLKTFVTMIEERTHVDVRTTFDHSWTYPAQHTERLVTNPDNADVIDRSDCIDVRLAQFKFIGNYMQ